jgi:hypothetical protein
MAGLDPVSGRAPLTDACESLEEETRAEESVSRRRRFKSARISAATW